MNKIITVVVPIYNMEGFLCRCLETLLNQTYKNYEILLIDDGSTDSSLKICEHYAENYPDLIRVIHKQNGGLSSARNTGINNSIGDYIIFPDPDDWVEPDYLEKLYNLTLQYPSFLACTGYLVEYDDESITVNLSNATFVWDKEDAMKHLLIKPSVKGFAWNKLYCTKIIKEYHLLFSNNVGTKEDLDFTYRYLRCDECKGACFSPSSITYHYYQRSGAATHSGFSLQKLYSIRAYENMIEPNGLDRHFISEVRASICISAVNMTVDYLVAHLDQPKIWRILRNYIKENWTYCIGSKSITIQLKIKVIIALTAPMLLLRIR